MRRDAGVLLFNDTFTNYYDPEIGVAVWDVLEAAGLKIAMAPNHCCGRPLISKGLLKQAREQSARNAESLYEAASSGKKIVFCEPSCLSAVREDAPSLLRGEDQKKARVVADACVLFEEFASGLDDTPESGAAEDPAAWSLPPEVDGAFACGEDTFGKDSGDDGGRSGCGVLRDGGLVRILEGSL